MAAVLSEEVVHSPGEVSDMHILSYSLDPLDLKLQNRAWDSAFFPLSVAFLFFPSHHNDLIFKPNLYPSCYFSSHMVFLMGLSASHVCNNPRGAGLAQAYALHDAKLTHS